jgi:hypothetical protein
VASDDVIERLGARKIMHPDPQVVNVPSSAGVPVVDRLGTVGVRVEEKPP